MPASITDPISNSKRKEKQCLTFIPEEEHAIKYRFEFSIVGEGGKEFADRVVSSDIADAYRPKVKPGAPEGESQNGEQKPLAASGDIGNQHVLFFNVGTDISKTELARIRFVLIERFSDSVPVYQEPQSAANAAVVLLFWNRLEEGRSPEEKTDFVAERLRDFSSRVAEVNFSRPKCKPLLFLHAFNPDESEEKGLREWHARHSEKGITMQIFDDDEEDTMVDAIQEICDKMLTVRAGSKDSSKGGVKSSCCVVS